MGYEIKMLAPWKINMKHTNHPFGKENDLPNLHDYVPAVNLSGCSKGRCICQFFVPFLGWLSDPFQR